MVVSDKNRILYTVLGQEVIKNYYVDIRILNKK